MVYEKPKESLPLSRSVGINGKVDFVFKMGPSSLLHSRRTVRGVFRSK